MDSCVLLAAYLKRDVIQETCVKTKPFLNINEEDGLHYHRIIIILKMLFVTSIMLRAVSNRFNHLMFAASNAFLAIMYSEIALLSAIAQCFLIFAPNKRFALFLSVSWMCILAMNIKSYEFILDLCALWSLLCYLWKAYKDELQKLWTVIYMMLSLGWYVCRLEVYGLDSFFLVIGLLVLAYIPLRPHWHNKHRHRLIFIYALMFLWIVFKFQLFKFQPVVQFQPVNVTQVSRKLGSCAVTDNLTFEVRDQFMSAKSLHESTNLERVCPSLVEDLEDSDLQKNTQSDFKDISTEEPEDNEKYYDDQNMQFDKNELLEPVEENYNIRKFLQAEETKSKYSLETFRESMESPLAEISKYESQTEELDTKDEYKLSAEEPEAKEEFHDQNKQRDEDNHLEPVEENDPTINFLQAEETKSKYSLKTFRESMESPLADISKYENLKEEWHTKDEHKLSAEETEVNEECHEQNMHRDENKQLESVEENDYTKNVLQDKQTNFGYSSRTSRGPMEGPLAEISKYENQKEWHVKGSDENVVKVEQNSEKSQIDISKEELQATDVRKINEMFPVDTRLDDALSTNTKHDSLTEPDEKREEKRETATDTSDSDSMLQSMGPVEETKYRPMIEKNHYEYLTTSHKLYSAKIDERNTQGEKMKEDFTRKDSTENNEKNIIKSVFDSKSKLNILKQVNIRDEIVTLDENSEDKFKPDEATKLSKNGVLEFKEEPIERSEVEGKEATSKIINTGEVGTEFTEKDKHSKSEIKNVLEKKSRVFSTQTDSDILHNDQERTDESQLDKEEFTCRNKKDISNTRLMTKSNVDGNADSSVIVGKVQNKNRKHLKRDTYLVKDELPDDIDLDLVAKGHVDVQTEKTLDSSDLRELKSSDSVEKAQLTIKIPPADVYVTHVSSTDEENKVNDDFLSNVEEITLSDEVEIPDVSKTRDKVKKMENIADVLQQDELEQKETKVNYIRNIVKKDIKMTGKVMERKFESTRRVKRKMKKPILRDVPNSQGEAKSRDVFQYKRSILEEAKRPDASRMYDFESENIAEWEESFKTHLTQEKSASYDKIAFKNSKKQQTDEDHTIMKNLFESFDDANTNEERLNGLEMAEYLGENNPFDLGLTDDYTYLVNENEGFSEDEDTEDNIIDQDFAMTESDDSTTNENERNDRMYVVFRKRNGEYYIM